MASLVHLDTHVLVWLYAGLSTLIPDSLKSRLESSEPVCSPMAALELQYLNETGRLRDSPGQVLSSLSKDIGLLVCAAPFKLVVERAYQESWTRDPFDRLIVAQARLMQAPLASKDRRIRENYRDACWD